MKTAINILQNIILPELEKDSKFEIQKTNAIFWINITNDLLHFEQDAKPVYANIYSLELDNPIKITTKLPDFFNSYIKLIAEDYVLGQTYEEIDFLLKFKNETFAKEVNFLQNLKQVVKSVERKKIKENLPKYYERLTFEISENDIELAAKMKSREDLKEKMKHWDKEIKKSEYTFPKAAATPAFVVFNKKIILSKLLIIQFFKYFIITATFGIVGTLIYKSKFKQKELKINPTEVSTSIKSKIIDTSFVKAKDTLIEKEEQIQKVIIDTSDIEKGEKKIVKNTKSSVNIKKDYKVLYYNIKPKIDGIFNYLTENQNENNENKKYKNEYDKLLNMLNKYTLIGKSITIYKEKESEIVFILTDEKGALYFYDGNNYYGIIITETPVELKTVNDLKIIEELDNILTGNVH